MCKDESVAYLNTSLKRELGLEAASVIGESRRVHTKKKTLLVICSTA